MCEAIAAVSAWNCKQLESSLLPSKSPSILRIAVYAYQFFKFCLFLPLSAVTSILSCVLVKKPESPLLTLAKRPVWIEEPAPIPLGLDRQPINIGFATADIQDSGPDKPRFAQTNWGRFYRAHSQECGSLEILPDTVEHPERVIEECQRQHVSYWRTSISLMPKKGESINQVELQKYCHFFKSLSNAGIHVMVTLNHFVNPEDLDWTEVESIERFVEYAEAVALPLYQAGIRQILTFNEIMVQVLQGYVMGKFPPHQTLNFEGGCKMAENMMRAHTKAYEKLKAMFPDLKIGLTHDPIRFRNYHKWNPLWAPQEKLTAHYLTEITHGAYMRLLQTGEFALKIPFLANESFSLPEYADKTTRPLDFIGGQYYTDPLLKFPTGSVSRNEDEKLTSYGYRTYPQGLISMLEELNELGVPIELTEVGIDTGINQDPAIDAERIAYFEKILQAASHAIAHGIDLRSIYWWTRDRSWEWHEQLKVDFSWYDGAGAERPVVKWLQDKLRPFEEIDAAG